jgi:glycerol-3-phosphate acyltransferase PlsX
VIRFLKLGVFPCEMRKILVGVDCNGGDRKQGQHPSVDICKAVAKFGRVHDTLHEGVSFLLFGHHEEINRAMERAKLNCLDDIDLYPYPAYFTGLKSIEGSRRSRYEEKKQETSLLGMLDALNSGRIDCAFSMGETASLIAYSKHIIGIIDKVPVGSPPLVATIPTVDGRGFLFADVGATVDTTVDDAFVYAQLCDIYSRDVLGVSAPRIAILSNGQEESKGNRFVRELSRRLNGSGLNYVGYAEGKGEDGILLGKADIVIAEGFVGNTNLKMIAGVIEAERILIRRSIPKDLLGKLRMKLGYMFLRPNIDYVKEAFNPDAYNGAPLLGLDGYIVKGHGSSVPDGICTALENTVRYYNSGAVEHIRARFSK